MAIPQIPFGASISLCILMYPFKIPEEFFTSQYFCPALSRTSLGLDLKSNIGTTANKRRSLVASAKKYQLCQAKRHRSRKSLARTHGLRLRMRTTSGRAVIKRRREKGRWQLCTKTNPSSGKRA